MARRQIKIPRSYYKRVTPPPAYRVEKETFKLTLAANLGSIGPDRNKGISAIRKMLLQGLATSIVNEARAVHINGFLDGWKQLRGMGQLDNEVAVIVDGSPQRKIKNVRFAGDLRVQAQASLQTMLEAVALAYATLVKHAQQRPYTKGYTRGRKGHSDHYSRSFEIYVSDKTLLRSPVDLVKLADQNAFTDRDWVTIQNYVPYAAKLQRYDVDKGGGSFIRAFKAVRRKYGSKVAVRFDFVEGGPLKRVRTKSGDAVSNAQPVIRIGQPGAFPSRSVNVRRLKKNAQNSRGQSY